MKRKVLSDRLREKRSLKRRELLQEVGTWAGWIGGWTCATVGLYGLLGIWIESWWVFPFSAGVLVSGLAGWRPLGVLLVNGCGFINNKAKHGQGG